MNRDDFGGAVLAHVGEVSAFARRLAGSAWDGDDLVQSTYERAFDRWRDLRELATARAWLFTIARRLYIDGARSRSARPELRLVGDDDHLAPEPRVDAATVERADRQLLEAALETLPDVQREAVLLCDLWGFLYAEIATIVGAPVGTVRSRVARGRGALIGAIAKLQDEGPSRVPQTRGGA